MTPYQIILALTTVFLFGYWTAIFLLAYHLIRFGIGTHPRRVALIMILGSVLLTIVALLLTLTIK